MIALRQHPVEATGKTLSGRWARRSALAMAVLALTGCATVPGPDALAPLQDQLQRSIGRPLAPWPDAQAPSEAARERIAALRAAPLSMDGAVELALLNHRGLQASLAELGVTQAELEQAARWPNPGITFARSSGGGTVEWERGVHVSLARVLLRPLTVALEGQRLAQQQARTAGQVVEQIAQVRRSWVDAVAAEEGLRYLRRIHAAAEASAELARRMAQAGNFNALTLAREQTFEAEAALNLARGERQRDTARERLVRALGLWGEDAAELRLPERLPDLPTTPQDAPDIERRAIEGRLDVQVAKLATEQTARTLGLTRSTRFVNVLEVGAIAKSDNHGDRSRTWELSLELPIFDAGGARVARAEALYAASLHRTAEIAINARSEAREAYLHYRHAWDIAQHLQRTLVPLAKRISDENLLRYNGMLIGVFELLADARAQIASVNAAIDARRDFWRADADLQAALLGRPALSDAGAPPSSAPAAAGGAGH